MCSNVDLAYITFRAKNKKKKMKMKRDLIKQFSSQMS